MTHWIGILNARTERAKISHCAILLRDYALHWHNALEIRDPVEGDQGLQGGQIVTFEDYKRAFLARFRRPAEENWREVIQLYSLKQEKDEPTEKFVSRVQNFGKRSHATPEEIKIAAMAGVRPEIREALLPHNVQTLDDLNKWAFLSEAIQRDKIKANAGNMDEQLKNLTGMMMEMKMEMKSEKEKGVLVVDSGRNVRKVSFKEMEHG